jgi:hypothetical protein
MNYRRCIKAQGRTAADCLASDNKTICQRQNAQILLVTFAVGTAVGSVLIVVYRNQSKNRAAQGRALVFQLERQLRKRGGVMRKLVV